MLIGTVNIVLGVKDGTGDCLLCSFYKPGRTKDNTIMNIPYEEFGAFESQDSEENIRLLGTAMKEMIDYINSDADNKKILKNLIAKSLFI